MKIENNADQAKDVLKIITFFTRKEGVLLFLSVCALFAACFVVLYRPIGAGSAWDTTEHVAILMAAGFGLMMLSRGILWLVGRKARFSLAGCALWIVSEGIVIVVALAVVAWQLQWHSSAYFTEVMGSILFAMVGIVAVPYALSILAYLLKESRQEVARLRQQIDAMEENVGAEADRNIKFYDKGGRLTFVTQNANVLYIEAADNYTNIHYMNEGKEECFILHNSMKEIERAYRDVGLVRCHRGYMVNVENVKLMRKEANGLLLELNHTTKPIPVSKSYTERVVEYFAGQGLKRGE